jgi:hypothetical protein
VLGIRTGTSLIRRCDWRGFNTDASFPADLLDNTIDNGGSLVQHEAASEPRIPLRDSLFCLEIRHVRRPRPTRAMYTQLRRPGPARDGDGHSERPEGRRAEGQHACTSFLWSRPSVCYFLDANQPPKPRRSKTPSGTTTAVPRISRARCGRRSPRRRTLRLTCVSRTSS